ncbi:hypothetical protein CCR94_09495 [Rhodoblastus sphagnicola]|uniref:Uncharacterized protein n=1 Tax=Rhodoblastus sphagnicola TaxID=333368 RepID=A0A2S6N9S1_9HYPH|nr:M48 family metallopeptidase [Rhodoblastus sphagnicola]MBB4198197.1 Zn-dependent protease with chaperone function [Rhodoblastus sphagnicola]PPQ31366.1 hypothetical protein CCR94_09495 [Rhodoblastus sphagnicola]
MTPSALYFDGLTSQRREVTLKAAETLELAQDGEILARWPWREIRRADAAPGRVRLRCRGAAELARLEFCDDAAGRAILRRCAKAGDDEDSAISTAKIVGWSMAAGLSILALAWFGMPLAADRLAPLVPQSWENRVGEMVEQQASTVFGKKTCEGAEGAAALDKLVGKLRAQAGLPPAPPPQVLASSAPNAFALPGGRVYLLRGIIDEAQSPDELAGVIAHEFAHVRHCDGLRRLIRDGGGSYLVSLLFGDITGAGAAVFATRALFGAAYSREDETAADATAIEVLRGLGRSPAPMGQLLVRVTGNDERLSLLASHPMSSDRLATMEAARVATTGPDLLDAGEFQALKAICGAGKLEQKPEKAAEKKGG